MDKETLIQKRYYELLSDEDKFTVLVEKDIEIDALKEQVKNLNLPVVSKAERSDAELLIAFLSWLQSDKTDNLECDSIEEIVSVYQSNL